MRRRLYWGRNRWLITLFLIVTQIGTVQALVIGAAPSKIDIESGRWNDEFTKYINVVTTDEEIECSVTSSGEISDWINIGAESFKISKNKKFRFPIKIKIPEDIPNGLYTGKVSIIGRNSGPVEGSTAMRINTGVSIKLNIRVVDGQGTFIRVLFLNVRSTNENDPIRVQAIVKNNAAIPIQPQVRLNALSYDKKEILSTATLTREEIRPKTRKTITQYLPSSGISSGIYYMHVEIDVGEKEIWDSYETFHIIKEEKKTENKVVVKGILEDALVSNANLSLGEKLTIKADFANTGDLPIYGTLNVEFLKDDEIVAKEVGEETYVDVGQSKKLEVDFKPLDQGKYIINIWVEYSGIRTAVRQAVIQVWNYQSPLANLDFNFYMITAGIILMISLWGLFYYTKYYKVSD